MVLLVTSDNEQFHADKDVVERSVLIKNMLEGQYTSCTAPVW
jgi:S-phase kinase-associated protein 1